MKVYRFTVYLYLIFGLFFVYDTINKYINGDENYILSLVFAVLAIFMFYFRLRSIKKIEERQNNNK
ncbi:hypothetical protein QW060_21175 [Myroides ceti]|uniref:Uncharacterized protein n=1 Tax=Paenimyroides ceti TaxID=395087 RepID=A0ABT8CXG0_9FLAO|nr:hypothetical protein [Paenimyroides ceti]MDN3707842.1 hypothetical protein [Paenimyroides ceti]MDN3709495.1 hypothetical protein [Paenimyroides ceti]